jgi:putative membrane protein
MEGFLLLIMALGLYLCLMILLSSLVLWIVGRLGLGFTVSGFGAAFIAAIVIAVVDVVVLFVVWVFMPQGVEWLGPVVSLVSAPVVLLIAARFVPGIQVNGFVGALVAAIPIGVINWLSLLIVSLSSVGGILIQSY